MKALQIILKAAALPMLAFGLFTGCGTTEGDSSSVSGGVYYGVGFYDPWYYGGYYPPDVIITPPPSGSRPHPEHPIARPLPSPAPRPMPSIPSTPRPAMRR
jgi:hypothetical protein